MEVNVICKEDKFKDVKSQINELGIQIISETESSLKVKISEKGYEFLAEIPGIVSLEKKGVLGLWK